jgi:hypothetical protein
VDGADDQATVREGEKAMKGAMECPVCKGQGSITENPGEYMFETRDPITSKCLICMGTGQVHPKKKLPDGQVVHEVARAKKDFEPQRTQRSQRKEKKANIPEKAVPLQEKGRAEDNPQPATELRSTQQTEPARLATIVMPGVAVIHVYDLEGRIAFPAYLIQQIIKAIKGE